VKKKEEEMLENVQKKIQSTTMSSSNIISSDISPKKDPMISSTKLFKQVLRDHCYYNSSDTSKMKEMSPELYKIFKTIDNVEDTSLVYIEYW